MTMQEMDSTRLIPQMEAHWSEEKTWMMNLLRQRHQEIQSLKNQLVDEKKKVFDLTSIITSKNKKIDEIDRRHISKCIHGHVIEIQRDTDMGVLVASVRKQLSTIEQEYVEKLSSWMIKNGFATGHGDTIDDLLKELEWQVKELRAISQKKGGM